MIAIPGVTDSPQENLAAVVDALAEAGALGPEGVEVYRAQIFGGGDLVELAVNDLEPDVRDAYRLQLITGGERGRLEALLMAAA